MIWHAHEVKRRLISTLSLFLAYEFSEDEDIDIIDPSDSEAEKEEHEIRNELDVKKNATKKRDTNETSDVSPPTITSRCYGRNYSDSLKHGSN